MSAWAEVLQAKRQSRSAGGVFGRLLMVGRTCGGLYRHKGRAADLIQQSGSLASDSARCLQLESSCLLVSQADILVRGSEPGKYQSIHGRWTVGLNARTRTG